MASNHRYGTFEEWYQWEMKQRDKVKNPTLKTKWHYPTFPSFEYVDHWVSEKNWKGEEVKRKRSTLQLFYRHL